MYCYYYSTKNLKLLALIVFSLFSINFVSSQVLITEESFDDEGYGDIVGTMSNGEPWEANTFNNCDNDDNNDNGNGWFWGVDNGDFVCNDVEGFDCCNCGGGSGSGSCGNSKNTINFGPIDISGYSGIFIEVAADQIGDLECADGSNFNAPCPDTPNDGCLGGNDQIVFSYSIDGGAYEVFEYYCGDNQLCYSNGFGCLNSGNSLMIKIEMGTQGEGESYFIEYIGVNGYEEPTAKAEANPAVLCEGQTLNLSETGGKAVSWSWSGPNGFSSNSQNPQITNVTIANSGTYTVTIVDANGCESEANVDVIIDQGPTASLTGNLEFCPQDCHTINMSISGGSNPYMAEFTLSLNGNDYNFTISDYDVSNQLEICYNGTGSDPNYNSGTNTLIIPESFVGNGTLTLTSLSSNGCNASQINPNFISLTFKDKIPISPITVDPICDEEGDGEDINLTDFDNDITGSGTVIWCEDPNCDNTIANPSSYYISGNTTVYAKISEAGKCDSESIPVTLELVIPPSAGSDNTVDVCNTEDCLVLIDQLGGSPTAGGTWNDDDGVGVFIGNGNCVDFTSVSAGTYEFTYTIQDEDGLCPEQTSTLTIDVSEPGNPGQDNTKTICNSTSCLDLVDLLGAHDAGGTWNDDDFSGVNLSTPTCVDFTSVSAGTYDFTYTIQDPAGQCQDVKATITIDVLVSPSAGSDNTIDICNTEDCLVLIDQLGGTPTAGGTWSNNGTGMSIGDGSCVDFTGVDVGTYEFTYTIQDEDGLCPEQTSILTIEVSKPGNPGQNGGATFCGSPQNTVDLESYLGANFDNNGTWVNSDGFDISDPNAVDMSSATVGTYEFRYQIQNAPCDMVEAIVTIEITSTLFAGDGNEVNICNLEDCVNLPVLNGNPDSGGTWNDDDNSQVNLDNPTCVDFKDVSAGTYHFTYTVTDPLGQCDDASSTLTINVSEPPYAGQNNIDSICNTTSCFDLVALAGNPDVGGDWNDDNGVGVDLSDPNCVDFTSIAANTYHFTYTIQDPSGQCQDNQATVTIEVFEPAFAGVDSTVTICNTQKCVNLYELNGNPTEGGSWNDDNATGVNLSDGKCVDFTNIDKGTYKFTYIVQDVSGKCDAQQSTLTLNIESTPNAGTDNSKNICIGDANPINLSELIGNHEQGGNWKQESGTPIGAFDATNLNLKDQPVGSYSFLYTVSNDCGIDSAFVNIDISTAPSAGTYHDYTVCENEIVNLFDSLFDNNVGGLWYDEEDNIISDPTNVTLSEVKTYTFKYVIPENGTCDADSSYAKITTIQSPSAGHDTTLIFCEGSTEKIDLISQLQPDEGVDYIFKDLNGTGALNSALGEIDISLLSESNVSYVFQLIVGENHMCGADTSNLNIDIVKSKNAGSDYSLTICNDENDVDIENLLGAHDSGGIWINVDNADVDLQNPKSVSFYNIAAGIYRFEYKFEATSSCPEASAIIEIEVNPITDFTYSDTLCAGQEITISGNVYSLENPKDTIYLTNVYGCDSILYISISEKIPDYKIKVTDENCFGNGALTFEELSGGSLPLKVNIDGNNDYMIDEIPASINDLSAGNHTYDIVDDEGCLIAQSETFEIKEFEGYNIDINYNSFEGYHQINVETNMDYETVSWSPADGLSCTDCLNPKASPKKAQVYEVTLTDKEGCTVTGTVALSPIIVIEIDVPNIFSPNNDGYNEVFFAEGNLNLVYSMRIYDRWGENVFFAENLKLNDATNAWDGTFKGEKASAGVYVYVIEYEIEDNKPQVISGDVLLLR